MSTARRRPPRHFAVIGAGIAGLAAARTLRQAGDQVTLFESADAVGGRMATQDTPFGSFDTGAQYFTVRDPRFARALEATAADVARPWSASAVRVLDAEGRVVEAPPPPREAHWVAAPSMRALAERWAAPLAADGSLQLGTRVLRIERDALAPARWQLQTQSAAQANPIRAGFDGVILALPAPDVRELLSNSKQLAELAQPLGKVDMAPCWTLTLAYPNAAQPGLTTLGPQWNAARSTHHRVSWLARESSKPGRAQIERWTIQASPAWSREHELDDAPRASEKLRKAFAEITGIRATPAYAHAQLWHHAQTLTPLGQPFVWDARLQVGLCGDWCLGNRVEHAFVSGLDLALAALAR